MPDFIDPYLNPKTKILKNLLNITEDEKLKNAEADIVYAKELILTSSVIPRTNDITELLSIHQFLFGDIYEWAGKIRTVDIAKHNDDNFFLIKSQINTALDYVFDELEKENFLKNLPKEEFINRFAYFYEQLNYIHPFREGNGRTQRAFWNRVTNDAGFILHWEKVIGKENNLACKTATENMNLDLLIKMFQKITEKL